jgi:hypothetical protein
VVNWLAGTIAGSESGIATVRLVIDRSAVAAMLCFASAGWVHAQTDEIQVYDAEIAAPGVFNLTWHNNYTPDGPATPSYPGGVVPNQTLNGLRNGLTA